MTALTGAFIAGPFEKVDVFNWTDPITGQVKPLRSVKMLWPHGDGTVTRESLTIPPEMSLPQLQANEVYFFPCTITINKKRQTISMTLIANKPPFLAPEGN